MLKGTIYASTHQTDTQYVYYSSYTKPSQRNLLLQKKYTNKFTVAIKETPKKSLSALLR